MQRKTPVRFPALILVLFATASGTNSWAGAPVSVQGSEALFALERDFAAWRADTWTREGGPQADADLAAMIERAEELLEASPEADDGVRVLAELIRARLDRLEEAADSGARAAVLAAQAEAALAALREDDPLQLARGRVAAQALHPGELLGSVASSVGREAAQSGPDNADELMKLTVEAALKAGELDFIERLGSEAIPALEALSLRPWSLEAEDRSTDPLIVLTQLAPRAAFGAGLEVLEQQGAIGRARVLTAFGRSDPIVRAEAWSRTESGWRLADARAAELLVRLSRVEGADDWVVDLWFEEFVRRDYAPGDLPELLPDWIARGNAVPTPLTSVGRQAAERLLVRDGESALAIEALLLGEDLAPLWALQNLGNESVRASLVPAFGARSVDRAREGEGVASVRVAPIADAGYVSTLERFLTAGFDTHATQALRNALDALPARGQVVFDPATLERWSGLGDLAAPDWVAAVAEHGLRLPATDRQRVLTAFARRVVEAADPSATSPALEALFAVAAESPDPEPLESSYRGARQAEGAGRQAVAALGAGLIVGCAKDPVLHADLILEWIGEANLGELMAFFERERDPLRGVQHRAFLSELPSRVQMELVRRLSALGYDAFGELYSDELPLSSPDWLSLASEPGHEPTTRVWMLQRLSSSSGPRLDSLEAPRLARAMVLAGDSVVGSQQIAEFGIPPEEVLRALLDARDTPEAVLRSFYTPITDQNLLERLLERLPPESWSRRGEVWIHRGILRALARREDPALNDLLLAANRPGTLLQEMLIEALELHRSPVHLPVAGAVLEGGVFQDSGVRQRAIDLVAGQMNDEAAAYLLSAARAWSDEQGRALLKVALEDLLEWQDAQARWARGQEETARRGLAVREMVQLLASGEAEQRVRALRGLAALEALEELPRILEALEDESGAVRKAAQAAFDRLTR